MNPRLDVIGPRVDIFDEDIDPITTRRWTGRDAVARKIWSDHLGVPNKSNGAEALRNSAIGHDDGDLVTPSGSLDDAAEIAAD